MVHPEELADERLADPLEVAQREVAFVELPIRDAFLDDPRDHRPDRRLVARGQRADGRLDPVGEHEQGRFPRLRLRPRVAELAFVDHDTRSGQLLRPGVEVAHDRGPVVLRDERDERLGEARLVGKVDAVDDVLLEDPRTHLGVELIVDVVAAGLVLDERERIRQLPHVMVIGCHAGHEWVGPDRLRRAFGQVPDHQRMVVGAGRFDKQPAEEGLRRVPELEELEDRQDPEHRPEDGECPDRRDPGSCGRGGRGEPQLEYAAQVTGAEQREDAHDQRIRHEDRNGRLDEHLEAIAASDRDDPGHPAEKDVRGQFERVVHRAADDRDDRDDHGRDRRVEQDREEHRDGCRRQEERERWPARCDLERQRRADDQQADEHEHVVPVPQARPEAPDPGQEHPDDEDREQEPARETRDVRDGLAHPERVDLLDIRGGQRRSAADDDLALADGDPDRRDAFGRFALGRGRELVAERGIRDDQRADEFGGEHPFGLVETAGHQAREARLRGLHPGVAQLRPQGRVQDAGRLGPNRRPARHVEPDERLLRLV